MEMHFSIWVIVGLIVSAVSAYVEGMLIFMVVGIIFMAVGIYKFIISKSNERPSHPEKDVASKRVRNYVKCSHCKAWNFPHAERCHHCGKNPRS